MLSNVLKRSLSTTDKGIRSTATNSTSASVTKICFGLLESFYVVLGELVFAVHHLQTAHSLRPEDELFSIIILLTNMQFEIHVLFSYQVLPPICCSFQRPNKFLVTVVTFGFKISFR